MPCSLPLFSHGIPQERYVADAIMIDQPGKVTGLSSSATCQPLSPWDCGWGGGTGCSLKARLSNELCKPEVPSSGPKGMELIPSSVLEKPHPQAILSGVLNSLQSLMAILPASEVKGVGRRWRERLAAPRITMER